MELFFDITWLWAILCLLIVFCILTGQFNMSNSYWKEQNVPYIPRKPFIGSINVFGIKETHKSDQERVKKFGRLIGTYEGQKPVLLLTDPDLIRQIFVRDFPAFSGRRTFDTGDTVLNMMVSNVAGEQWKRIRCIISPTFATGKIKRMSDIIMNSAETLVQNFASTNGAPVDAKKLYGTFTMDVIASAAFATKIYSYSDPNNEFLRNATIIFRRKISWKLVLLIIFPQIVKMFKVKVIPRTPIKFFKKIVFDILEERAKTGMVRNDFLQLMIDAEKEFRENSTKRSEENTEKQYMDDKNAEEHGHEENNAQFLRAPKVTKFLSHNEMVAQCVLFFLAGYDTTASTLTFASHLLALNEDIQDKLRDEVDSVLKEYDNNLTYEGIQDMKYLDCVISETLRLYAPAVRVERVADVDYKLGDTGITIKKGTVVTVPTYALHHDPEFYEDPEKFMPERFMPEKKVKRHPYTYLPFGAGPRNCVAMRFALMEVKFCLAHVISQFKIVPCEETKKPVEIFSAQGILQPLNIIICFEKRTDCAPNGHM